MKRVAIKNFCHTILFDKDSNKLVFNPDRQYNNKMDIVRHVGPTQAPYTWSPGASNTMAAVNIKTYESGYLITGGDWLKIFRSSWGHGNQISGSRFYLAFLTKPDQNGDLGIGHWVILLNSSNQVGKFNRILSLSEKFPEITKDDLINYTQVIFDVTPKAANGRNWYLPSYLQRTNVTGVSEPQKVCFNTYPGPVFIYITMYDNHQYPKDFDGKDHYKNGMTTNYNYQTKIWEIYKSSSRYWESVLIDRGQTNFLNGISGMSNIALFDGDVIDTLIYQDETYSIFTQNFSDLESLRDEDNAEESQDSSIDSVYVRT